VAANPEAIAWYVKKSEGLLNDLRARVLAQRTRGGQLAGFAGAVLALVGANAESVLDVLSGSARAVAGVSLLLGCLLLMASLATALRGTLLPQPVSDISIDKAARAVERAEYFFFAGLFTVGAAFATLIVEVTF
jgi:cytochrome c biogenesis factor